MPVHIVETRQLRYRYAKTQAGWILDGLNVYVQPGETLLLCGASGSGKSTLLRTFNGLIPHFYGGRLEGTIRVAGCLTASRSVPQLFDKVAMVFQNPDSQLFNATVEHEIAFGLESLGLPRQEIRRRIRQTCQTVKIAHLLGQSPQQLSGGEKQLVAIAAVLALKPRLIVLDEPYANLDPAGVRRIRRTLAAVHRQSISVLISEHRLACSVPDAARMLVLHAGRVVLEGSPQQVLTQHLEAFGLESPPAVKFSRRLGIRPPALDIAALAEAAGVGLQRLAPALPAGVPAAATGKPLLSAAGLCFEYQRRPAVKHVSFVLNRGECLAVVGANGAGKTTLLKLLNGLLAPSRGRIRFQGQDLGRMKASQRARHIGTAFQNPDSQFFKSTVREEIEVAPRVLGCYDPTWLQHLVDRFQLEAFVDQPPYRLSGGEKKRVAFAAALAARPEILLVDEPTAGQDARFRRALGKMLGELCAAGRAIIMVTHDLSFAEQYAHRWLVMARGEAIAAGPAHRVMENAEVMARAGLEATDVFQLRRLVQEHAGA